jgi:hypothetical protein
MKKIKIIIMLLISLVLLATQCENENCHNVIPFANNSDRTLYVYSKRTPPFDTILEVNPPLTSPNSFYKVLPNSMSTTCTYMDKKNCYDNFSKVIIFILDEQVVTTIAPYIIERDYMILRRYDFTPDDLQILNWEGPYPPSEAMKNMKMYPPYEE